MTPKAILDIKADLLNGLITWDSAREKLHIFFSKRKPWHTKEWKLTRAEIIGSCCQQCGSESKPLVIQHFSHGFFSNPTTEDECITYIKDIETYFSMADTETWCRRCAYKMDRLGLKMCPSCSRYYHFGYGPLCWDCD